MLKLSQVIFFSIKILPNRVKNQKCQYYIKMLLSSILHVKKQFLKKFWELYLHVRSLPTALPLELDLQNTAGNRDKVIRSFSALSMWYGLRISYYERFVKNNQLCLFFFLLTSFWLYLSSKLFPQMFTEDNSLKEFKLLSNVFFT